MSVIERGIQTSASSGKVSGGRSRRSDYVFIDASQVGLRAISSVRLNVSKGFRARSAGRSRNRSKKVVVYNFGKKGQESFWLGKLKARKAKFRKILAKICAGLPNQEMIDYCRNNIALVEGDRPSIEQLSRGFGDMADGGASFGLRKSEFMTNRSSNAQFKKAATLEAAEAEQRFETAELVVRMERIGRRAKRALASSRAHGLEAK